MTSSCSFRQVRCNVVSGFIGYEHMYSETSLIRHSMGPENNVGLGGCWIMECLLPYLCMVTVPHIMVGLKRMLDYRGVELARFHCTYCSSTVICSPTVYHHMEQTTIPSYTYT